MNDINYNRWRRQIKNFLSAKDLWKNCKYSDYYDYEANYLRSDNQKIEFNKTNTNDKSTDASATSSDKKSEVTSVNSEKVAKALKKWKRDDKKTVAFLAMSVSEKYSHYTELPEGDSRDEDSITAYEIWVKLRVKCEAMLKTCLINARREYQGIKMRDNESLLEYLGRVEQQAQKLADLGKRVPEEEIVQQVLATMSEEYDAINMSILLTNEKNLTLEFLAQQFLLFQNLRGNRGKEGGGSGKGKKAHGYHAGGKPANEPREKETRSCFKCGTPGHIARDCRAPKEKIERFEKSKAAKAQAHNAEGKKPEKKSKDKEKSKEKSKDKSKEKRKKHQAHNIEVTSLFTEVVEVHHSKRTNDESDAIGDAWVMDSGCTHHMTNDKSKLEKPEKSHLNIVTALGGVGVRNDQYVGKVHLECVVEEENRKIVLEEVLSVPDLRRNLLSVSQICQRDEDIRVVFDSEGFKVQKNGISLLEGQLRDGLYLLRENPPIEANIIEISSKLRTWHERLGHLSISSMKSIAHQIDDKEVRKELEAISTTDTKINCVACDQGKMARNKIL